MRAVSLFSNCGAGDLGYARAGFKFAVVAELEPERLEVAARNHPGAESICGDLRQTWPDVVLAYRCRHGSSDPDLLAACPPCQGMSSAQAGRGLAASAAHGSRDDRNLLVVPIAEVARELTPRAIVVENVTAFFVRKVYHPRTGCPVTAARLLANFLRRDYEVFPLVTDLADFGVPQTRRRAFLTFIRRDQPGLRLLRTSSTVPYPVPTHAEDYDGAPITIAKALRHVPPLSGYSIGRATDATRPLHAVPVLERHHFAMVKAIPRNSGAGAWESRSCSACGEVEVEDNVATCPECGGPLLRPVMRSRNGRYRLVKGFRNSSYHRNAPDAPAATVTTASGRIGSDFTIHHRENRVLSPLECARLQTIPDYFQWGTGEARPALGAIREMIGEAVPPRFTLKHGLAVRSVLSEQVNRIGRLLPATDVRTVAALARLNGSR
jgi:DNA (cytosine-5)-methyltransferase 1